jgi:hypothetical protein
MPLLSSVASWKTARADVAGACACLTGTREAGIGRSVLAVRECGAVVDLE